METLSPARYRAKYSKRCTACRMTKQNKQVRERIYKAWFERTPGEETLEHIAKEIGISSMSLYRHANNHLRHRVAKMTAVEQMTSKAQDLRVEAMKALEVSFDHGTALPKEDYEQAVDNVIIEGLAQMQMGKEITINQLLAAAKLKGEWKLKKRGQDAEILKMVYRGASGFKDPAKP